MKKLIVTVASALLVTGAYAQTAPAAAPAAGNAAPAHSLKAGKSATDRTEVRINQLHADLKITPDQEAKWGDVAQAMRDEATQMDELIARRQAQQDMMSAVDDLNNYAELAQAHADGVKKMSAVFAPLYNSMSDEQKKVADETFHPHQHPAKQAMKHSGTKAATSKAAVPNASSQP
jgi:periplasmic protein CpxP/Spy